MSYSFYVTDRFGNRIPVHIRPATESDFQQTVDDSWQTSWSTEFVRDVTLEKYAFEAGDARELVALGAYYDDQPGVCVYIAYAEAHPESNPTIIVKKEDRRYYGIGKMVIAFGVFLSLQHGYDGTVYFKALTTKLYLHYKKDFGALDMPAGHYMLIIFDAVAQALLKDYVKEEDT